MTAELHLRWFVAHTHPHAEAKATTHLNRQGFEIYFPRYLKRRRHARRIETVAAPLFPRYLFVAIDLNVQRWRSIYSTVGVSRLVCNGDDPTAVPDGIVEALKQREDPNGFIKLDSMVRFHRVSACSRAWPNVSALPSCLICWAARFAWCWTPI